MYENNKYFIFSVDELTLVNFDEVLETSIDTVRKSVDETKTFVKWDNTIPECVESLITKEGPYTYEEILTILSTSEWSSPMQEM